MTDMAPDFDFTEMSNAAEAEAIEAEGGTATPAEDGPVEDYYGIGQAAEPLDQPAEEAPAEGGRERGPDGRFLPREAPAETTADEFYAGRYKSREETERGIAEAQSAAQRAQAERDQYRQQVEQYEQWAREQQTRQQQTQGVDWDSLIDQNPAQAAELARRNGDDYHLQQAAAAWEDLSPGAPQIWWQNQQLQARLDQIEQAQRAQVAPLTEAHERQAWGDSIRTFTAENPWFNDVADHELMEAGGRNPLIANILQQAGDPNARIAALKTLGLDALNARGALNAAANGAVQDIARTQAQEGQRAREDAFVASSQTTTAQTPLSREEQLQQDTENRFAQRSSKWEDALVYGAPRT